MTFREQLFGSDRKEPYYLLESHPAYDLRWRAGESKDEFERLNKKEKVKPKKLHKLGVFLISLDHMLKLNMV